ncbi:hypothetical protein J422_03211 [Methanocaldococcus villosus KIN24-T80]|uniref:DUF2304 domain-containing protein n=1 Tax=Methanocaldococcus villosus KIN24-T80 TaxID=1069083 RepID=N6UV91_9EURY|nr:DUF2304 family protein [Methanocaldococcus villosus]ENN96279.1 hypothetical protein J422_03211 [Methanocaldococcus villosus KIN24-T80]
MLIQIFGILFCIFALIITLYRTKKRYMSIEKGVFWVIIWMIILLLLINPNLMSKIADILGVGRGVDAIVYTTLAILLYLVYKLFERTERLEREITKLVREIAIKDRYEPKKGD